MSEPPLSGFRADLPIGLGAPALTPPRQALIERIQRVLGTRPGELPWRPDFGCDLANLVGRPATAQLLSHARWCIEQALHTWIPEVSIEDCQIAVKPEPTVGWAPADPLENALFHLGSQATLEVKLVLKTPDGTQALVAEVAP